MASEQQKRLNITGILQTCAVCPSQWNARTDDGRRVYIRYRWGGLEVHVARTIESDPLDDDGEVVLEVQLGDQWDGRLSYDELRGALGDVLDLPLRMDNNSLWNHGDEFPP